MKTFTVDCTYGSEKTPDVSFVVETDHQTYWYCVEGSPMVNESTIEPFDGCDVECDLNDIDCFEYSGGINSLTELEQIITSHLEVETVDRVTFTLEIDGSINQAFQDDNAKNEIIRILKNVIGQVEDNYFLHNKIKDINGNNVGNLYLDIEKEDI
jgi:hypothetical protein